MILTVSFKRVKGWILLYSLGGISDAVADYAGSHRVYLVSQIGACALYRAPYRVAGARHVAEHRLLGGLGGIADSGLPWLENMLLEPVKCAH